MSEARELTHQDLLDGLLGLAREAIGRYAISPEAKVRLINLSENATYAIDDPASGKRWAMRVHRDGYHSRMAIASELVWQQALKADGAATTPRPVPGRDGELIQIVPHAHPALSRARHGGLFEWEEGHEPASNEVAGF